MLRDFIIILNVVYLKVVIDLRPDRVPPITKTLIQFLLWIINLFFRKFFFAFLKSFCNHGSHNLVLKLKPT